MKFISQDGGDGGGSKGERQDEVEFLSVSKRQIRMFLRKNTLILGRSGSCALTSMFRFWSFFSASYHLTLLAELNVLQRKARAAAFHDRRLKQKRERCLLSSACTHVREMQCNVGEFFFSTNACAATAQVRRSIKHVCSLLHRKHAGS